MDIVFGPAALTQWTNVFIFWIYPCVFHFLLDGILDHVWIKCEVFLLKKSWLYNHTKKPLDMNLVQ